MMMTTSGCLVLKKLNISFKGHTMNTLQLMTSRVQERESTFLRTLRLIKSMTCMSGRYIASLVFCRTWAVFITLYFSLVYLYTLISKAPSIFLPSLASFIKLKIYLKIPRKPKIKKSKLPNHRNTKDHY